MAQSKKKSIKDANILLTNKKPFIEKNKELIHKYWSQKSKHISNIEVASYALSKCGFERKEYIKKIHKDLEKKILTFVEVNNSSLFILLLSVFFNLLYRYSNQDDLTLGITLKKSSRKKCFIDHLLLHIHPDNEITFVDFLDQVKKNCAEVYTYQNYSFYQLLENLNSNKIPFKLQISVGMLEKAKNTISRESISSKEELDLALYFYHCEEGIQLVLQYNSAYFTLRKIKDLTIYFVKLLENVISYPNRKMKLLDILPIDEFTKKQAISESNVVTKNSIELFREKVKKQPNKTALIFEEKYFSYQELENISNKMSFLLRNLGTKLETPIILFAQPSINTLIAMFSILKAGGICVPANPNFSIMRLGEIIYKSPIILADKESKIKLPEKLISKAIIIEDELQKIDNIEDDFTEILPAQAAFIIYTSGSTGKPNGVVITHHNLANMAIASFPITHQDICCLTAPIAFVASLRQIFSPLCLGATLVVVSSQDVGNPRELFSLISKKQITVVNLVTSYCKTCAQVLSSNKKILEFCSLRKMIASGEKLSIDVAISWSKLLPNTSFYNGYGQTETTSGIMLHLLNKNLDSYPIDVPVGKPTGTNQIYFFDKYMQLVPQGAIGEMYVSSHEIARGYYNDTRNTACRFIPNPLTKNGDILYKTGDWGRKNDNDDIEILGRIDSQIKIRGYRVNSLEVEMAIREFKYVDDVVVIFLDQILKSFILVKEIFILLELQLYLKTKLPEYMIPQEYFLISCLPKTATGKVDKTTICAIYKNLPETKFSPITIELFPSETERKVSPRNSTEYLIYEIFCKYLQKKSISIFDNFFLLGGHSLLVPSLFLEIEKKLKISIPFTTIYENTSVVKLAQAIKEKKETHIITINPNAKQIPIVFIHAIDGHGLNYHQLINKIENHPIFIIEAPKEKENFILFKDIESTAKFYIESLRSQMQKKEVILAGHSYGGVVAFEMALQLEKLEIKTAVCVFDTHMLVKNYKYWLNPVNCLYFCLHFPYWFIKFLRKKNKREVIRKGIGIDAAPFKINSKKISLHYRKKRKTYNKPVLLFKAFNKTVSPFFRFTHDYNWKKYTSKLEIIHVEGDHHTLLRKEYTEYIFSHIKKYIKRVDI